MAIIDSVGVILLFMSLTAPFTVDECKRRNATTGCEAKDEHASRSCMEAGSSDLHDIAVLPKLLTLLSNGSAERHSSDQSEYA